MPQRSYLREILDQTPVIDTHEHIRPMAELRDGPWDFIQLCKGSYVAADLRSAGMSADDWPPAEASTEERWKQLQPWARRVDNTAYYRSLLMGCRKLHELPEQDNLNVAGIGPLTQAMDQMRGRDDLFDYALGEIGGIELALQDPHWQPYQWQTEGEVLKAVFRINNFVMAPFEGQVDHNGASPRDFAEGIGFEISGFGSYLELIGRAIGEYKAGGGIALKSSLAYDRTLDFQHVERDDAQRLYEKGKDNLDAAEMKALQDFLMNAICEQAREHNLPIQIHTGIRAGSGDSRETNPSLLTDLISAHPQVTFDLFHGGYPYSTELSVMAKGLQNVYLDICWMPIISPSATGRMLHEWLDSVPAVKIVWGGDCGYMEASLGALEMAKIVIGGVLDEKVAGGYLTRDRAATIATGILHDNAVELFGLG